MTDAEPQVMASAGSGFFAVTDANGAHRLPLVRR
jgi:hypothetical protein